MSTLYSVEAFKDTFKDLKDHGPTSLFVAGLLALGLLAAGIVGAVLPPTPVMFATQIVLLVIGSFVAYVWLPVAITTATYDYATGSDPGVGRLLARSFKAGPLFRYFGVLIMLFLILIGLFLLIAVPIAGTVIAIMAGSGGDFGRAFSGPAVLILVLVVFLGIMAYVVLAVFVYIRYAVAGPAAVLEATGPVASLRRSSSMTKGHRFDALLGYLMLAGVGGLLFFVIGGPALIISFPAAMQAQEGYVRFSPGFFPATPGVAGIVGAVSTFLITAINTVITASLWTNFYIGLRSKEAMGVPASPAGDAPRAAGPHGDRDPGEEQDGAWEDQDPGDLGE